MARLMPVSSMNLSRSTAKSRRCCSYSVRKPCTRGVSRSLAWSDFFLLATEVAAAQDTWFWSSPADGQLVLLAHTARPRSYRAAGPAPHESIPPHRANCAGVRPHGAVRRNCRSCASAATTYRQTKGSPQTARQSPYGSPRARPRPRCCVRVNLGNRLSSISCYFCFYGHTRVIRYRRSAATAYDF